MSVLDTIIDAYENEERESFTVRGISHVELREELARLRRMARMWAITSTNGDYAECGDCGVWLEEDDVTVHTATCDVAIHLNLPREKGEGSE